MELEFHAGFFKKLDFRQIEFQNRGISLNSFKHEVFYWKVSAKGVFCHFGLKWHRLSCLAKGKKKMVLNMLTYLSQSK